MGLRATATEMLHQAALVGMFLRTGLEFVILVARTAVMHQLVGVKARTPQLVELGRQQRATCQHRQSLGNPVGMRWTAGNVDHRQSRCVAKLGAEQAARGFAVVLQATGVGRVHARGGNAAPGRTAADSDDMPGPSSDLAHPVDHRPGAAAEAMKAAAAARPAQERALDAENIDCGAAVGTLRDQLACFIHADLGNTRMPEQFQPLVGQHPE